MIGKQTGNYRILKELGKGGMGIVYKANQTSLGRMVAMKVLPEHLTSNPSFIKRFKNEARAIAKLNHPNIVQIFDIGEEDGVHYYTMEFIEGTSLDETIYREGRLPLDRSINIVVQIGKALQYAHSQGIVHRDIKPSNIMIDKSGRVKVTDFGLALQQRTTRLTIDGGIVGTPEYMSPEQAAGQTATPQSDIYSLGIVFYELLTGKVPFEADSPLTLLNKIQNSEPQWPCSINPEIPIEIEKVIKNMMAKKPSDRYGSCQELIQDVQRFKTGRPVSIPGQRSMARWVRKAAVTGLALITLAGGVVFLTSKRFQTRDKRPAVDTFLELRADLNLPVPGGAVNFLPSSLSPLAYPPDCEARLREIDEAITSLEQRSARIHAEHMWPDLLVLKRGTAVMCDILGESLERVRIDTESGTAKIPRTNIRMTIYATPEAREAAKASRAEKEEIRSAVNNLRKRRAEVDSECESERMARTEEMEDETGESPEQTLMQGTLDGNQSPETENSAEPSSGPSEDLQESD